jgi:hypothetical protein
MAAAMRRRRLSRALRPGWVDWFRMLDVRLVFITVPFPVVTGSTNSRALKRSFRMNRDPFVNRARVRVKKMQKKLDLPTEHLMARSIAAATQLLQVLKKGCSSISSLPLTLRPARVDGCRDEGIATRDVAARTSE